MAFSHVQPVEPTTAREFAGDEGGAPTHPQFTASGLAGPESDEFDVFEQPRPQRSRQRRR